MTTNDVQQRLPKYRAELFADRQRAIQEVISAINALLGTNGKRKVLTFRGGRGLGKSWLAFHLARTVSLKQFPEGVLCLLIGLGEAYIGRVVESSLEDGREWLLEEHRSRSSDSVVDTTTTLRNLLEWFAANIGASTASDASLAQLVAWIGYRLKQQRFGDQDQYRALVCIVDSVYEVDKPFRAELEKVLLNDLAQLPNVLLVMTGRGNKPDWTSFYVRRYEQTIDLGSLREDDEAPVVQDEEEQRAQRQQEVKQKIAAALSESLGKEIDPAQLDQPLNEAGWLPLNVILASLAEAGTISWVAALDELLRFVPEEQRVSIRSAVVALSVFQGFREPEVREIHKVKDMPNELLPSGPQPILDILLANQLASWESEHGWWNLDSSLRALARLSLKKKWPDYLRRLHTRAHEMYTGWAEKYDDEHYRKLAAYHKHEAGNEDNPTKDWPAQAPTMSHEEGALA